jgi:hypothetical protein
MGKSVTRNILILIKNSLVDYAADIFVCVSDFLDVNCIFTEYRVQIY